ncbi:hypothetical protein [Flavobacterium ustbae]|uniref:hypothetical protein n=1 Tax=Flavobacterium ustbae TaxID=2488790 RepID=UPI000F7B6A16|nr:hypothetical protein [Flavobacterium ustbae]
MLNKKKNDEVKIIVNTLVVLPKKLADDINNVFPNKISKNHVYSFISLLVTRSHQIDKTTTSAVPFSSKKFTIYFGSSYHNWLNLLLDSHIVMRNSYYSKDKKVCLKYWINPIYNIREVPKLNHNCNYIEIPIKLSIEMTKKEINFQNLVTNDFKNLIFNESKLLDITKRHLEDFSMENFLVDEHIDEKVVEEVFKVQFTDNSGQIHNMFMNRTDALINSKKYNQNLIYDKKKNKFYSYKLTDFIILKKSEIERHFLETILRLLNKKMYARRNKTNFRVDTNLTNCPNILFKQIMADNDLCQIDMSNAQFAIFAYSVILKELIIPDIARVPSKKRSKFQTSESLLRNELEILAESDDFKKFASLASGGNLYDEIVRELGLKNREEAKTVMFQILFSSHINSSSLKTKFKIIFPNVINYIDRYKKCYGHKNFSVGLQRKESEIFIDGVYERLKKANIATITRHDSIIVSFEDEQKAWQIINEYFRSINFKCNLVRDARITDKFYAMSKLKGLKEKLGKKGILQVLWRAQESFKLEDYDQALLDKEKDVKNVRAPKKSRLNFNK